MIAKILLCYSDIIRIARACPLLWREGKKGQRADIRQRVRYSHLTFSPLTALFPRQKEKATSIVRPFLPGLHVSRSIYSYYIYSTTNS